MDPLANTFWIEGTGFLIGPKLVLTNRHIIASINAKLDDKRFPRDRRQVAFLHPEGLGFRSIIRPMARAAIFIQPARLDFGLIEIAADPGDRIGDLTPCRVTDAWAYDLGQAIAMLGYAGGKDLLRVPERNAIYRMGPILQQGYISAIAPWDHGPNVDRILLDIRSAGGMSGSPILHSESGDVIGIHDAAAGAVTGFGLPLDTTVIASLVAAMAAIDGEGDTPARVANVRRPH